MYGFANAAKDLFGDQMDFSADDDESLDHLVQRAEYLEEAPEEEPVPLTLQ